VHGSSLLRFAQLSKKGGVLAGQATSETTTNTVPLLFSDYDGMRSILKHERNSKLSSPRREQLHKFLVGEIKQSLELDAAVPDTREI
jgi:hypothetical protein